MTEVLCIASQKGGVGKTTASIQIAAGLSLLGYKTLLIDLDPQRNSTSVFTKGLTIDEDNFGVYSIFRDEIVLEDQFFIQTRYPNLKLLPSSIDLSAANTQAGKKDGIYLLRNSMVKYKNFYDFIIIDCPPNLSFLTLNAFAFATGVLVPLQISKFSIDGVIDLLKIVSGIQERYNPSVSILGALINNFNARTSLSRVVMPTIQKHIRVLKNKITTSVAIEEANFLNQTLYEYDDKHKVTQIYKKVVKELLKFYGA